MKILRNDSNRNIVYNSETNFRTDLGWEESFQEFEKDTLESIINPAVNFETVRYAHKSCTGGTGNIEQMDIWFYFYFYNNESPPTHVGGLNYELIGLTPERNAKVLRQDNDSFFRLEFYKVPEGENPNSSNRKLVFTKHLPIPLGERVLYSPNNERIYVPVFMGSNFRNKENMYLFWFQDNTVMDGTLMSGNTFYMTAKFFNTIDGKTISFTNNDKPYTDPVNEEVDVYYRMDIERVGYTYTLYSGSTEVGCSDNPIRFYAASDSDSSIIRPSPTPSAPPPTPSSSTPAPTPSISVSSSVPGPSASMPAQMVQVTNYNASLNITDITVNGVSVSDISYPILPSEQKVGSTSQIGTHTVVVTFSGISNGESVNVDGNCYTPTIFETYITQPSVNTVGGIIIGYYANINCTP